MATNSISFDRAANYYDQTRHLSEPMATQGLQLILDRAGPRAKILEVGAGTGRIGVPLLQHGADWIGCDLSIEMMSKLRAKIPAARLARVNAAQLPFVSDRFDAVITIHVLHLVGPWRAALREIKRVLKPGGVYLNNGNWHDETAPSRRLRNYWRERITAHGAYWQRPGLQSQEELAAELRSLGATLETTEVARWHTRSTPREEIDSLASRQYSESWNIPDDVFNITLDELREWAAHEYGDLDQLFDEERRLIFDTIRF